MPLNIHDKETEKMVRTLANLRGVTPTQAVRDAARTALEALSREPTSVGTTAAKDLRARLRPIQEDVRRLQRTGLKADKEFFDRISDCE